MRSNDREAAAQRRVSHLEKVMHLSDCGAQMMVSAANLNSEIVHRDNAIEGSFKKLFELEEAVATIRRHLEEERERLENEED